jgi:hypothetical protein
MTLNKAQMVGIVAIKVGFGASLAFGFGHGLVGTAYADTSTAAIDQGIADGESEEDEPGWSCVDDGNRVCGPNNTEGKPAACYADGGVIVALWPCSAWTPEASDASWGKGGGSRTSGSHHSRGA